MDRLGLFEPLTPENVRVVPNPSNGTADVHLALKQKTAGRWFLSGSVGPFSVGGPLRAAIGSRLPSWGRGIVEGSSYFLTFGVSAFSGPLPIIMLERPYLLGQGWKSGFAIAPQLGSKGMLANGKVTLEAGSLICDPPTSRCRSSRRSAQPRWITRSRPIGRPVAPKSARGPCWKRQ